MVRTTSLSLLAILCFPAAVTGFVNPQPLSKTLSSPPSVVNKQQDEHQAAQGSSKLDLYRNAYLEDVAVGPYGRNAFTSSPYGNNYMNSRYRYGNYGRFGAGYGGYGGYGGGYGYGAPYVNSMNFSPYVSGYGRSYYGSRGVYNGPHVGSRMGYYGNSFNNRYFNGPNSAINSQFTYGSRVNSFDTYGGTPYVNNMNSLNDNVRIDRLWRGGGTDIADRARFPIPGSQLKVQGDTLKTWSFQTSQIDRVQVCMNTEGRPLHANVELWQGPDNNPQTIKVYIEDGAIRPFNCIIETPGGQNTIGIRNTNTMEFPLTASVDAEVDGSVQLGLRETILRCASSGIAKTVQGRAVFTKPFPPEVQSVQILLQTDGRPLNARVEMLQGPNNNKQVMDVYTEDGYNRPFFIIMETPEEGTLVRIVNTATMEFPLSAVVEPYVIDQNYERQWTETGFFNVD